MQRYLAIAFGRPCTIDDSDCNVGMVVSLNSDPPNPLLTAHVHKFQLYRIVGQFLSRKKLPGRSRSVKAIHDELTLWREHLPSELRMESYADASADGEPSILQMQALALQLTYDNIQIMLHRTAAFEDGNKVRTTPEGVFSLHHLTEASLRTAELYKFSKTLQACRRTHANMHVGITLFTAGVVLCIVCIVQPLSAASQRAKTGIMHIISVCKSAFDTQSQSIASRQSVATLERLVAVVLRLENQIITGQTNGLPLAGDAQLRSESMSTTAAPRIQPNEQTQVQGGM